MTRLARWAPLAGLLFLTGCVATQRDVLDMEQQTDEIKAQITDLKKTIASLQANQADLAVKLDQMHSDVNTFSEAAQDSEQSMTKLSAKLDDLQAALGRKVSAVAEDLTKQQNQLVAKLDAQEAAAKAAQTAAETAAQKAAESNVTPSKVFHSAETALYDKRYSDAVDGFSNYLQQFPKGEMTDLALYFLGEAQYRQNDYEDAARQFATVLDKYPKSDITPAARLKYAMCLMDLKIHLAEAKRYLESIPEDFPKAPEAAMAKRLLKKFGTTVSPK